MSKGGNCISVAMTSSPRFFTSASVSSAEAPRGLPISALDAAAAARPARNTVLRVTGNVFNVAMICPLRRAIPISSSTDRSGAPPASHSPGLRGALSTHAAAPVKPIRRRMMSLMF
jgi:hypothetical protein